MNSSIFKLTASRDLFNASNSCVELFTQSHPTASTTRINILQISTYKLSIHPPIGPQTQVHALPGQKSLSQASPLFGGVPTEASSLDDSATSGPFNATARPSSLFGGVPAEASSLDDSTTLPHSTIRLSSVQSFNTRTV